MTGAPAFRPPEAFVHGVGGPVVVVPGRVALWIARRLDLDRLRAEIRGRDGELDSVLLALSLTAHAFRTPVAAQGNSPADDRPTVETFSTKEAAAELGIKPSAIRMAIRQQRLPAHQRDGRWQITAAAIADYRRDTRADQE